MAFPQVADADTASGSVTSNSTTWSVAYPANCASGDLLLLFMAVDGNATTQTFTSTGWAFLSPNMTFGSSAVTGQVGHIVATGFESGSVDVTLGNSEQGVWRTVRIPRETWWGTMSTGLSSGNANVGTGTSPDPGNMSPSWGVVDILWIAFGVSDHGNTTYTAAPANYSNFVAQESGGAGGAGMGIARRELTASSEDAGAFTADSEDWAAQTVAIRPGAPIFVGAWQPEGTDIQIAE